MPDCPCGITGLAGLKVENDARGRLGRVRPAARVQGMESEVRVLVHEPSVLSPQRQVARKSMVGASAVQKGASSLSTSTRHGVAKIARRIKDQTATSCQCVSVDSSQVQWKFHHHISYDGVHVGLDSGFPEAAAEISLSISVVTIVASPASRRLKLWRYQTWNPQVSVVVRVPCPLVSLVKKPVPCRLISDPLF